MSAAERHSMKSSGTMRPNQVRTNTFHGLMVCGRRQLKSAAMGAQPAAEEKTMPW
jgi:hypothetical protein